MRRCRFKHGSDVFIGDLIAHDMKERHHCVKRFLETDFTRVALNKTRVLSGVPLGDADHVFREVDPCHLIAGLSKEQVVAPRAAAQIQNTFALGGEAPQEFLQVVDLGLIVFVPVEKIVVRGVGAEACFCLRHDA